MKDAEQNTEPAGRDTVPVWVHGFIAIFAATQVIAPVTYYLGDDPADERFAWRMFSVQRAERCRVVATETVDGESRPIPLVQVIHQGWRNAMGRRRLQVIEAFSRWRCEDPQVTSVQVERLCRHASGQILEPDRIQHPCQGGTP